MRLRPEDRRELSRIEAIASREGTPAYQQECDTLRNLVGQTASYSPQTHGHVNRVGDEVGKLGKEMGLSPAAVSLVTLVGSAHDVGKSRIPTEILESPNKLTDQERAIMNTHPAEGAALLGGSDIGNLAADAAHTHHEKWSGGGYPQGLRGTQTPLIGRMTAVCDVYDAMTARRSYKSEMSHGNVLSMMTDPKSNFAGHFDPQILTVFANMKMRELGPEIKDEERATITANLSATSAAAAPTRPAVTATQTPKRPAP